MKRLQALYLALIAFLAVMALALQSTGVIGGVASVAVFLPITKVIVQAVQMKVGVGIPRSYKDLFARCAIIAGLNTGLALIASGSIFGLFVQSVAGGALFLMLLAEVVFCLYLIVDLGLFLYGKESVEFAGIGMHGQVLFDTVEYRSQLNKMILAWVALLVVATNLLAERGTLVLLSGLELVLIWFSTILILNWVGDLAVLARPRLFAVTRAFGYVLVLDLLLSIEALQASEFVAGLTTMIIAIQLVALALSLLLFVGRLCWVLYWKRKVRMTQLAIFRDILGK